MLVDIADVVFRAGVPYYRYGDYGRYDRLVGAARPLRAGWQYRYMPVAYGAGYRRDDDRYYRDVDCNKHGKCKVTTTTAVTTGATTIAGGTAIAGTTMTMTTIDARPCALITVRMNEPTGAVPFRASARAVAV